MKLIKITNNVSSAVINSNFFLYILGIYLFTVEFFSRNCGILSLCGPTIVEMYKNNKIIRTFSRNLAIENKADTDMVST